MEKLARLGTDLVHTPVEIFHPVLAVPQDPVIQPHQLGGEMMRLFHSTHHSDRIRLTIEEPLHTRHDRGRRGPMSTTGVGRDDQYFRDALLLGHELFCASMWPSSDWQPAILRAPLFPRLCAPSSSLFPVA